MASARGSRGSNYDVFLSFRGPDTRHGFIDCLYKDLKRAGIRAFVDNERLHVGEEIGEELMRAIDNSKICIPVFSRGYASSKWCLLELERIMMVHSRSGQEALPVFYHVSPDDVKLGTSVYRDDLEALEKEHGIDMVDQWRKCLKEVCKIKGWNLEESQGQGTLIKDIVQEVLYKTKKRRRNVSDHLVEIEGPVEAVTKHLDGRFDGDLLQEIVVSTGGLPLALEVLGSHLFGQTKAVWKETLRALQRPPHQNVQNALMISYESLRENEKEIFLDIACFFVGYKKRLPMYMWESLDLYPESGMNSLCRKSVINIGNGDRIWMHEQLSGLGREIVRKEGKSSRIWKGEEALRMISDKKGTNDVVMVDLGYLSESCKFKKSGFKELTNLRALRLSGGNLEGDFRNCFPQLRYLEWTSFPSNFRAQNFNLPKLAVLILTKTDIDGGWTGWNRLLGSELKVLELSGCGGLTRTPDLSACLGLEILALRHCCRLTEIDDSIGKLQQLTDFEIKGSPNLKGLPDSLLLLTRIVRISVSGIRHTEYPVKFHLPICFDNLKSLRHLEIECVGLESLPTGIGRLKLLEHLSLAGCSQLTSLPESVCELESLVKLNLSRTGLMSFPGQIENMKELEVLNMSFSNIRMLPKGIGSLAKLEELKLFCCESLEQIPSEIGNLFSLRVLELVATRIVELPSTVSRLSCLEHLDMHRCWELRKVEQLPVSLSHLSLPYFSLQVVPDLSNLVNLIDLRLFNTYFSFDVSGVPITDGTRFRSLEFEWIERMPLLKRLEIRVPVEIFNSLQVDWSSLSWVKLHIDCYKAQSLSQLPPTLSALNLYKFQDTILQMSLYPNLKNLVQLVIAVVLTEEIELRGLEELGNLETMRVGYCQSLMRLSIVSWPKKINDLVMSDCPKLVEVRGLGRLESLHHLLVDNCPLLPRLPDIPNLVEIKSFWMFHCNSIESMPALPRTKHPFELYVVDCGKLHDFRGPHDLYRDSYATRNCFSFLFFFFSFLTSCFGLPT